MGSSDITEPTDNISYIECMYAVEGCNIYY